MAKTPTKKKTSRKKSTVKAASSSRTTKTTKKTTVKKGAKPASSLKKKKTVQKKQTMVKKPTTKKTTGNKKTTKKQVTSKTTGKKSAAVEPKQAKPAQKSKPEKPITKAKSPPDTSKSSKTTAKSVKKTKSSGKKRAPAVKMGGQSVVEAAIKGAADADGYVIIKGRRVRTIATGSLTITKKSKSTSADDSESVESSQKLKPKKTRLSTDELDNFDQLLRSKRMELIGDLDGLEQQALKSNSGDISHMPIHMADVGSDTFDQDFMLGLAEKDRTMVREIDEALLRIQNKTYGVCEMTGKQIPKRRLEAKPWAKYTIEAARHHEAEMKH